MTRYGHIGWRVAAVVVAFVGTAALAVILTRAPDSSQAALPNVVCPTSGLQTWLGLGPSGTAGAGTDPVTGGAGTQAAGNAFYTLEFTNVSHRACRLYGYPEVSAYVASQLTGSHRTAGGNTGGGNTGGGNTGGGNTGGGNTGGQIGSAAIRDTSVRPQPVMLEPGATAHSVLHVAGVGGTRPTACDQVTAEELRVTFPHQGRSAFVPIHIPVCSRKGHVSLSVQAIQARPGIPGYMMP